MANQVLLSAVEAQIISERPCPELSDSATQLVFGEGNPEASVVFIGEAPGAKEDLLGRPFVGRSGVLLNELLASIGLDREQVYITNIVKYRPPKNRDPKPSEKALFLPYLFKQLEIIAPKVVVTLGRHAAQCFLPELVIGRDHGTAVPLPRALTGSDQPSTWLIPLFHPAVALYNGARRSVLFNDMLVVADHLNLKSEIVS